MEKVFGIIVVYNKNIKDSVTYQCLKNENQLYVVVCDNSIGDYDNQRKVEADGNIYVNMGGNSGLSKAYNRALDTIFQKYPETEGYVMLFDDDTLIPEDYFVQMKKSFHRGDADIYLPIVNDEIGILSPLVMKRYYCHRVLDGDVWKIKPNEISGINSGMTISIDIFKTYRYNEEIFLDYVDHNFIRDMRKQNRRIEIVETYLQQSFSSNIFDMNKELIRLALFKKDLNVFYKHGIGNRFVYHYMMLRRKTRLALKYKKIRILFK